ncbi:MAG: hypothetical protein ABL925_09135 [Methylococcales bacterium]
MKNQFNEHFRTRLWQSIADIEQQSQVELVVIIKDSSAGYEDIPLIWGCAAAFLSFSYIMFAPNLFDDLVVYFAPIAAFALAWLMARMPLLKRLSIPVSRRQKAVQIMARALFQKGGIQHTRNKIGVLIYCSVLEQSVYVLADRGAELALPAEEWALIKADLQQIFTAKQPDQALLTKLAAFKPVFNRYIPPVADDLKELADDLEITL